jgi:hypothetical protein
MPAGGRSAGNCRDINRCLQVRPPVTPARAATQRQQNDCFGKLTKEHWISAGILRSPTFGDGKNVNISELFWQQSGVSDVLPVVALSAKVLCEHHNNALTRLDSTATRLHSTVEHFYLAQLREHDSRTSEFDLISGEAIERWLLKLIWGRLAAANEIGRTVRGQDYAKTLY